MFFFSQKIIVIYALSVVLIYYIGIFFIQLSILIMCIGLNKEKGSLFACKGYDVAYTDHFKSKEDIKIDDMFLTLIDSRTNLTKSMVKYSEQISVIE